MRLLKNREVQLTIVIVILTTIILGIVIMYIANNHIKAVNTTQIEQNIAVIGAVVKKYPQLEADIIKNYTKGYGEDYAYGKSILEKYSYDENSAVDKNISIYFQIQIAVVIYALLIILFLMLSFNRIFRKIQKISYNAEATVEGKFEPIDGANDEGEISFLIHQFNSMAERLNENVQQLNNEKIFLKRLITDISHQLKTPLASLVMFNDIMRDETTLSDQDRATFVAESKNQLDRMEWLIKNLLKMAKLEAGVVEFNKQQASIAVTVNKSINGLKNAAAEKKININFNGDNNIIVGHDVGWTTEALSNIIKNCIEHSCNNSQIDITLDENNVFVQISIQDRGPGISKEELPKIFDRFYKGMRSNSPTNIGIGLFITKTIIEGQGGAVYATSSDGKGTRFIVRIMKFK